MNFFDKFLSQKKDNKTSESHCSKCGAKILPVTAKKHGGQCAPCASGRDIAKEKKEYQEKEKRRAEIQEPLEREWEDLLGTLPQKALLAFTARCIRRIYFLLVCFPTGIPIMNNIIQKNIASAEQIAGGTIEFENISSQGNSNIETYSVLFMLALARLMQRTEECENPEKKMSVQSIIEILVDNGGYICGADFSRPFHEEIHACVKKDLALLKKKANTENWTDDTPVPAALFGPLWPNGSPIDWAERDKAR